MDRGRIQADNFRMIFRYQIFPASSFAIAHDLAPTLREKIKECFFYFKFTPEMSNPFYG